MNTEMRENVTLALDVISETAQGLAGVYAMFSGGHDSLTSTALAAKHDSFGGAIHINTGIGIEETREFVRAVCSENGWPLIELHTDAQYERLVLDRGGFPYGVQAHNSMLYYLKQKPLADWFRGVKGRIGFVTGIRRAESVRRMGAGISTEVRPDGRKLWISPILDWTKIDCGRFIEAEGLRRNPVVDLLHRSGECLCGALAQEREIHEIDQWFPQAGQRIHDLERACEQDGLVACVWAGKSARKLNEGQQWLFPKSDLVPLCTTCESRFHGDS